jgi:hypothetical protein
MERKEVVRKRSVGVVLNEEDTSNLNVTSSLSNQTSIVEGERESPGVYERLF